MQTISFGRWLKKLRAGQDLTQEMLAELVGCATPTLRAIENGLRRPSREMAERIADVLKTPADQRSEFLRLARQPIEAEQPDTATPKSPPPTTGQPTIPVSQVISSGLLIGRAAELHTLNHWLQHAQQRLVTITGPGGMGKSRLAQQVAAECGSHFPHGAAFVSLAAVADGANVPTTIADGLGLDVRQAVDAGERVLQLLAEREQLVVLDNFEHLLAPASTSQASAIDFVQNILQRSTGIRLLITSRERLRISRERTFEVGGLATQAERSEEADATMLFIARAQQVAGHFVLNNDNRHAVARICTLLGGMPLAIELAASWVRVLTCAGIADEIQRSLDFLILADRDTPPRHRSMRVVFEQSWSLLSETERRVLAHLALFRGGCRREAAQAVAEASIFVLAALIDKSLLRKEQVGAHTRYTIHELIRQYAEEQLRTDPGAYAAAQRRHGDYYLGLVAASADEINSPRMPAVTADLSAEIDNLRLAWGWAVAHGEAELLHRIGMTMWIFLEVRAFYREGAALFRRAAEMAHQLRSQPNADHQLADRLWAHMRVHQAYFTHRQGRSVEGQQLVAPALALLRQLDEPMILQQAHWTHGAACWYLGEHAAGVADYRAGLAIATQLQAPYLLSLHNNFLGCLLYEVGQYEASFHHLSLGVHHARQLGDPRSLAFTLNFLNRTALALRRAAETAPLVAEAMQTARLADDSFCVMLTLEQQALLRQVAGDLDEPQRLLDEAHTLAQQIGDGWSQTRVLNLLGDLALHRGELALARRHFVDSYQLARRADLWTHALAAVAGLAALLAAAGEPPRAFTLAQLVITHRASNHDTRLRASQLVETLTAQMTADVRAVIQSKLQNSSFEALVTEVLEIA